MRQGDKKSAKSFWAKGSKGPQKAPGAPETFRFWAPAFGPQFGLNPGRLVVPANSLVSPLPWFPNSRKTINYGLLESACAAVLDPASWRLGKAMSKAVSEGVTVRHHDRSTVY